MKDKKNKVHILDASTYEVDLGNGDVITSSVQSGPPHAPPKGKIWHYVLGKFVPESWKHKEMWVDESEVFPDDDEETEKSESPKRINSEVGSSNREGSLLNFIDGLSDDAALAVIEAYKSIPDEVKDATEKVYEALKNLGGDTSMDDVKQALSELKEVCGEWYGKVYELTFNDVKKIAPKIQTRIMMEGLDV